jgi:signal transduction histidine kinase
MAPGPLLRRRTVRFRLTALYCCVFFPSGVVLVFITYFLIVWNRRPQPIQPSVQGSFHRRSGTGGLVTSVPRGSVLHVANPILDAHQVLIGSSIIFVALLGASVLLGWIVSGRVLRPLRVMTTRTHQISEHNLHERLALDGPADELKDLGDTIDGLLARLEAAFDSQQRFVANASHELRTPLMLSQTLLQVALANPAITFDALRAACQEAVDVGKDQAQLIDALLILARSQRGLDHRESVDLPAAVQHALDVHTSSAAVKGLKVDVALDHATASGDARLIDRLVSNLVDNAIRYNITGGRVRITATASTTEATLTVTNTGPPIAPDEVSRLTEPFQRAGSNRTASPDGLGLGLSIVAQIAEAHHADLQIRSEPEGGLTVMVRFPSFPLASTVASS